MRFLTSAATAILVLYATDAHFTDGRYFNAAVSVARQLSAAAGFPV